MNTEREPDPNPRFPEVYFAGPDTVQEAAAKPPPDPRKPARAGKTRHRAGEVITSGPGQEIMEIAGDLAAEGQRIVPQYDGSVLIENIPPSGLQQEERRSRRPTAPKEIVDAVMKLAGDPELVTMPDSNTFIIHNHPQT